ncbi:MAG: AAA family ATPase [Desulfurococcales archaeon]|nr:AAA family ATPase [Desulfurococcales archaeon]
MDLAIKQKPRGFVFGVGGLDSLLGESLRPGSLLVVAGHPGAGKTTLGATMCLANAVRGNRCLYFSVQEPREKLYANMKRIGIDLEEAENRGLLRFIKLPLVSDPDAARDVLNEIGSQAAEQGASVVIVDSVTPILKAVRDSVKSRSVLQEFFATLPMLLQGVVVLLAEIPIIEERVELGDIEFVADTILLLTHRIEKNRLVREIVIRKARGSPLTIARVPFAITEKGLRVWAPPNLETIPALDTNKVYKLPCDVLRRTIGPLYGGMSVYISYPVDARPYHVMPILMGISVYNNAKTLIITYTYSPSQIINLLLKAFSKWEPYNERTISLLREKMNEVFEIKAFNPSAYSVEELYAQEMLLISKVKPDIVVFFGTDALSRYNSQEELTDLLRNQTLFLKSMGSLIFRLGSNVSENVYVMNSQISDAVIRFSYVSNNWLSGNKGDLTMYIWVSGLDPVILDQDKIQRCGMEAMLEIRRKLLEGG